MKEATKKALIIGGTNGFGLEVANLLARQGYMVSVIGRRKSKFKNYSCDIGNLTSLEKILDRIKDETPIIDLLACIVGYARARSFERLTMQDWEQGLKKNLLYAALALQKLTPNLKRSINPRVITIGSQWSHKVGSEDLVPYTIAKHALLALTEDYAQRNPDIFAAHYCVPTMNTPQYYEVRRSFVQNGREEVINRFANGVVTDYRDVAKELVDFLDQKMKGGEEK